MAQARDIRTDILGTAEIVRCGEQSVDPSHLKAFQSFPLQPGLLDELLGILLFQRGFPVDPPLMVTRRTFPKLHLCGEHDLSGDGRQLTLEAIPFPIGPGRPDLAGANSSQDGQRQLISRLRCGGGLAHRLSLLQRDADMLMVEGDAEVASITASNIGLSAEPAHHKREAVQDLQAASLEGGIEDRLIPRENIARGRGLRSFDLILVQQALDPDVPGQPRSVADFAEPGFDTGAKGL